MIVINVLTSLVVVGVSTWAFYVLAIPILGIIRSAVLPNSGPRTAAIHQPRVVVMIPAHNMESYISKCIESLLACDYPKDRLDLYVTADHCTDRTAQLALAMGATVLEREVEPRGKTYTLAWTIEKLKNDGNPYDVYVIVDATVRVDRGFIGALVARWAAGAQIVIGRPIVDPDNLQWFARCLGLTLAHRNLQNWARDSVGMSALIGGRGMAYDRAYIERFGWSLALPTIEHGSSHPTEDWRHGVRVVDEGYTVAFASGARLYTPLRETFDAATEQGVRWERGRLVNMASHGSKLLLRGVKELNLVKIAAGLDAIQPPVAVLAGVSILVAGVSLLAPHWFVTPYVGLVPLAAIAIYSVAVVYQGRQDGIKAITVLWAPIYVAWRCAAYARAVLSLGRSAVLGRTG